MCLIQQKYLKFVASCIKSLVPDGTVGGVWVMGQDSSNWGAHFGILGNNHLAKWWGKDGWLVHVFHCHLDWRRVAKWAQAQEVRVNIPICSFNSQRKGAFCFKVERLEETDRKNTQHVWDIFALLVKKKLVGLREGETYSVILLETYLLHLQGYSTLLVHQGLVYICM